MRVPRQTPRRASVVGAGSFGTAVAVLLERAGMRTTLLCRTPELAELVKQGVSRRAGVVSLAKGLVPPEGEPPTLALERTFGAERVACVGGPAHAKEMVESGAGLVCASHSEPLAHRVAVVFQRAGVG